VPEPAYWYGSAPGWCDRPFAFVEGDLGLVDGHLRLGQRPRALEVIGSGPIVLLACG
jgi:hypothetical protein